MKDADKILTKIDNLISEDSTILKNYENKISRVSKDKEKYENDKKKVEEDITVNQTDMDDISKVEELVSRFSDLEEYEPGLKKLGDSCVYIKKINKELERIPAKVEELENRINDLTDKSLAISDAIENADEELNKLEIELSDAKRYQYNLIDLIDIAKTGEINKTREEVQDILKNVGFSDKDATNGAKIVLFPEEDLIPFFNKGKKPEKVEEVEEYEEKVEINDNPILDKIVKETEEFPEKEIEEPIVEDVEENEIEDEEEDFNTIEMQPQDFDNDFDIKEVLKSNGLNPHKFNKEELLKFKEDDIELINRNVDFLLENNFKKEFIYEYPIVLVDTELKEKLDFIIKNLEKDIEDIRINPVILISYSIEDFTKLIDVTSKTGIKPQNIPLMVYIKGLQAFLQNYVLLVNNGINIDENELFKLASVLTINPVDFKLSLETVLNYGLSLKKGNGKYAIILLAKSASQLMKEMDLIIEVGEEDILKYYPEVLSSNVMELVNRLKFIKKTGIPYKAESHGDVVYQSYVLNQEKLNRIVEKKLDLHEVLNLHETNEDVKRLIKNEEAMEALNNITQDEMIEASNLKKYDEFIKLFKHIDETNDSYMINGIYFSKKKVNRNLNYLLTNFAEINKNTILLASLLHDARKSTEEINKVITTLGIKVG